MNKGPIPGIKPLRLNNDLPRGLCDRGKDLLQAFFPEEES